MKHVTFSSEMTGIYLVYHPLITELIFRKKDTKQKIYAEDKEPSDNAELPANEIYMNVRKPEHEVHELESIVVSVLYV